MGNIEAPSFEELENPSETREQEDKKESIDYSNVENPDKDIDSRFEECIANFKPGQLAELMPEMPSQDEEGYEVFADRLDEAKGKLEEGNAADDVDFFRKLSEDSDLAGFKNVMETKK
ncbi:hypothetical protein [Candidatus Absconditicoccus praedator]|uniref:hypothetical protein n=1 Tax=Candidatus Absconditicoccus praedator TaxID=2735562 RepID=UPI001E58C3FA|nr:hypothetical protein [Candidatus Absconditicoccus praedator]UFX83132.1 hypothetical protein HLG78_03285 [Candidatus Absconditicoccus praedator]